MQSARIAVLALATLGSAEPAPEMARLPGGSYTAFYPVEGEAPTPVTAFLLDVQPVTNAEFLAFVRKRPEWQRSRVSLLFADSAYLSHWAGELELGDGADAGAPVTFISWFAADAFCRARDKRLPTEAEWELAAAPVAEGAERRAAVEREILAFYARPRQRLPRAGSTAPNAYGVRDLHGVIWEWILDFDASFAAADNRSDRDRALESICGGAAVGAADATSYTTFMRVAFRSSLQATYALHHLGFRCARSLP